MENVVEKLNLLFGNQEFLEKNSDLDSIEGIYSAVSAEYPEITIDEMKEYLVLVSKSMHNDEFSEDDLDDVFGGITVLGACAAIAAVGGAVTVCYNGGKAIGKAIYYIWG